MKTQLTCKPCVLLAMILLLATAAATPARAGLDVDFGAALQIGDDTDIYLAISSRYFDREEQDVRRWKRRCADPDDLAVALFIARHGEGSPDAVFALREKGMSWWEIGVHLGVPPKAWFVPVDRTPGPPYGKAYGYWKKNRKRAPAEMRFGDADVANLVAARMLHEYYGVSIEVAMEWRASGRDIEKIAAGAYRDRHGKAAKTHGGRGKGKGGKGGK